MLGPLSLVDVLFVITVILLVFNGLRNGFVFSLINLLSIPIAFFVAFQYGPSFIHYLAQNNLSVTPLIAYIILFFAVVLVVHIIATVLSKVISSIPVLGGVNSLLGGIIGFVEAWLLWVVLLIVLHSFLQQVNHVPGVTAAQFSSWQAFYNQAVSTSLFAHVNSFIVSTVSTVHISN
jgi:uncharacterized membrane protein required for colicin V production